MSIPPSKRLKAMVRIWPIVSSKVTENTLTCETIIGARLIMQVLLFLYPLERGDHGGDRLTPHHGEFPPICGLNQGVVYR